MRSVPLTGCRAVRSVHTMERVVKWFALCFFAVVVLASCGTAQDGANDAGAPAGDMAVEQEAADLDQADYDAADSPEMAEQGPEGADRQVITSAYAAVEVDDTGEAVAELVSRTTGYGGHVEDRRESTDDDGAPTFASLTLRVPAEHLPEMLDELDELGEVSELSESARDVTGAVRDLDARIEALETSVDRLLEIMAEAESAEDLLQVETTLSERQADLEALQAERNALGDQVEMSTLQVELSTEPLTEVEADGFLGGLQSGWNALVMAVNAVLVAAGALLPWLLVLAVPLIVIALVVRGVRRGRSKRRATAGSTDMASERAAEPEVPGESEQAVGPESPAEPGADTGAEGGTDPDAEKNP